MNQESLAQNPFMMMLSPESVIAAMERSEKLGRLNRRQCSPLDRPGAPGAEAEPTTRATALPEPARDD
jgi:hypothetical protein